MQFSERLRELRCEKGVTLSEVARSCKVSIQCISSLEMGTRNPTGSTVITLADYFGVSTDYLLGRSDDLGYVTIQNSSTAPTLADDEAELLALFRKMDHAQKVRAVAYCEGMLGINVSKLKA